MYTLKDIIKYMGYTLDDLDNIENVNLKKSYNVRKLDEYDEVKQIFTSPKLVKTEKLLSLCGIQYLYKHGLFDYDIVLADVGWHGTTQYILNKIQKSKSQDKKLLGLYIGCLDGTNKKIGKGNYASFIFNEDNISDFSFGIIVLESLILAPHGSTEKYEIKDNEPTPILGEQENISAYIKDVQSGALDFVKEYSGSVISNQIKLNRKVIEKTFINFVTKPEKDEINWIGKLNYENFYCNKMADPKSILFYIWHPKKFLYDFKYSPWRIGFMYKLFGLRLPYAKLYSGIRKFLGKKF